MNSTIIINSRGVINQSTIERLEEFLRSKGFEPIVIDTDNGSYIASSPDCELIEQVVSKIQEYNLEVHSISIASKEFTVSYNAKNRAPINYSELSEIRQIVDPQGKYSRAVTIFGMNNMYNMNVHLENVS